MEVAQTNTTTSSTAESSTMPSPVPTQPVNQPVNPVVPPAPTAVPASPSSSPCCNKTLIFVLIFALVVAVGAGAFFILNKSSNTVVPLKQSTTFQNQTTPVPSPTSVAQTAAEQEVQNIEVGDINADLSDIETDLQGL